MFENRLQIDKEKKISSYKEWLKKHKHLYEKDFVLCKPKELLGDKQLLKGITAASFEKNLNQSIQNGTKRFYKVPFEKVPFIAKKMTAFMKAGNVYLGDEHVPIILTTNFKKIL